MSDHNPQEALIHLPQEILIDIFARLPTKYLVRLTSICKSWYSVIASPKFISHHLDQNANDRLLLVRLRTDKSKTDHYCLALDGECPASFSWLTENPECLGDVEDQAKTPLCSLYAVVDASLARLAISNPTIHRPKVDIVNLAKQVAAHMPIFADLPDAQNNRSCLTLAILDYMREKGVATENDHVLRIQDYECFHSRRTEEGYRKIRWAIFAGPICGEFSIYKGIQTHKKENGIYKGVDAKGKLRERIGLHAVSMVGYGDKAGDKYFEGKNSWGKIWCDGGYAEMDPSLFGRIGIPIGVSLEGKRAESGEKPQIQSNKRKRLPKKKTIRDLAEEVAPHMESKMDKRVEYLLSKVVTIAGLPSEQLAKRGPTQDEEDALSFREAVYALSGGRRGPDARWINWFNHNMSPEHIPTFKKLINLFQQCKSGVLGSGHGSRSVVVAAFLFYLKIESKLRGKLIIVVPPNDTESWSIALQPFFQITTHHRLHRKCEVFVTSCKYLSKNPIPQFVWEYVIFQYDEHIDKVMEKLKGKNKLLIAPENPLRDVKELSSMLCFLLPKYFRSGNDLNAIVEKGTTHEVVDMLNSVVDIFNVDNQRMLEHVVYCMDLGEGISVSQKKIIREIYKMPQDATREGIDREQALDQLLAMVKCCNHLSLSRGLDLTSFNEEDIENTGKIVLLDRLLKKLDGSRIVIVSQMTRMLDVLEQFLKFRGKEVLRIDETSALEECKSFCAPTTDNKIVRLLSTRAGCLGISLLPVEALIFYDTNWWNPHIDMEVICCAPKEVMVYYLFTMGIFEETVQKLQTMESDRDMDIRHAFKRQKDVDDEWLVRAIWAGLDLCHSEESTIANADFNVDKV